VGGNHNSTAKVIAQALSATATCHTRLSTAIPLAAPFEGLAEALELLVVETGRRVATNDDEDEDSAEDDDEDEDTTELMPDGAAEDEELVPDTPEGGGVAVEGSTSAPTPQGTGSPLGCFALAGSSVWPSGAVIVKRVVQVLTVVPVAVNW